MNTANEQRSQNYNLQVSQISHTSVTASLKPLHVLCIYTYTYKTSKAFDHSYKI